MTGEPQDLQQGQPERPSQALVRITTASSSVYLVDFNNCRVMRVGGVHGPTPRLGANGVWCDVADLPMPWPSQPFELIWGPDEQGQLLSTVTSNVVAIEVVQPLQKEAT